MGNDHFVDKQSPLMEAAVFAAVFARLGARAGPLPSRSDIFARFQENVFLTAAVTAFSLVDGDIDFPHLQVMMVHQFGEAEAFLNVDVTAKNRGSSDDCSSAALMVLRQAIADRCTHSVVAITGSIPS